MLKLTTDSFHYDYANDILYYSMENKDHSYGDEDPDNIVFMKDIDTDAITGITILDFVRMYQAKDKRMEIIAPYFDIQGVIQATVK